MEKPWLRTSHPPGVSLSAQLQGSGGGVAQRCKESWYLTRETLYSGMLSQCPLGNSDPSVSDPIPTPNPAQSLGILNSMKAFIWGIGEKGGKVQKHWRSSTMWYIKIVVTKLFESKADYLFYWIKPTSQKKKGKNLKKLFKTHTHVNM